jgi:hypothetical protein
MRDALLLSHFVAEFVIHAIDRAPYESTPSLYLLSKVCPLRHRNGSPHLNQFAFEAFCLCISLHVASSWSHKDWRPAVTTDSAWCLDLPIHPFMDAMSPSPHGVMQRFLPSGIDPDVCPQLGTKDLARCFGQFHSSECLKCPSRRGRNRSRLRIMLLRLAAPRSDSSGSDSPG